MDELAAIENAILKALDARPVNSSICPSEVARAIRPNAWRPLMPHVRTAAAQLVARGLVTVTQIGEPVDPIAAVGPIRLRLSSATR